MNCSSRLIILIYDVLCEIIPKSVIDCVILEYLTTFRIKTDRTLNEPLLKNMTNRCTMSCTNEKVYFWCDSKDEMILYSTDVATKKSTLTTFSKNKCNDFKFVGLSSKRGQINCFAKGETTGNGNNIFLCNSCQQPNTLGYEIKEYDKTNDFELFSSFSTRYNGIGKLHDLALTDKNIISLHKKENEIKTPKTSITHILIKQYYLPFEQEPPLPIIKCIPQLSHNDNEDKKLFESRNDNFYKTEIPLPMESKLQLLASDDSLVIISKKNKKESKSNQVRIYDQTTLNHKYTMVCSYKILGITTNSKYLFVLRAIDDKSFCEDDLKNKAKICVDVYDFLDLEHGFVDSIRINKTENYKAEKYLMSSSNKYLAVTNDDSVTILIELF